MQKGTVARFSEGQGFGFIQPLGGGAEVFVHRDNVFGGGLLNGDEVEYVLSSGVRELNAKALHVSGGTDGERWGLPVQSVKGVGGKKGKLVFFDIDKGFGFILQDCGGRDLFVQRNDVIGGGLFVGDSVQYDEVVYGTNGKSKATNVSGGTGGLCWGRPHVDMGAQGSLYIPNPGDVRVLATDSGKGLSKGIISSRPTGTLQVFDRHQGFGSICA